MTVKVLRYSNNIESDIKRGWSALSGMRFGTEEEAKEFFSDYFGEKEMDIRYDDDQLNYGVVHHDGLSCFIIEDDGDEVADADYIRSNATFTQAEMTTGKVSLVESFGDGWHLLECAGYEKESLD